MTPISPDCEQGKHGACSGDAWDHDNDAPADCACSCHRPLQVTPRQHAMAGRAVALLQYAAVDCLPEDQAVSHAVRLLRGPKADDLAAWRQRWVTGVGSAP